MGVSLVPAVVAAIRHNNGAVGGGEVTSELRLIEFLHYFMKWPLVLSYTSFFYRWTSGHGALHNHGTQSIACQLHHIWLPFGGKTVFKQPFVSCKVDCSATYVSRHWWPLG